MSLALSRWFRERRCIANLKDNGSRDLNAFDLEDALRSFAGDIKENKNARREKNTGGDIDLRALSPLVFTSAPALEAVCLCSSSLLCLYTQILRSAALS